MKKKYLSFIAISIVASMLTACGVTTEQTVENQKEQEITSGIVRQTEQPESEVAAETEIATETETETESVNLPAADEMRSAYEAFLRDNTPAILDKEFFAMESEARYPVGDEITLQDMIAEAKKIGGAAGQCSYAFMEEFPEKPILAVRLSGFEPYPDENNIIFFVLLKDDGLHITDIENSVEQAYTGNILTKEGLLAINEFPTNNIVDQDAKLLDENGQLFLLYSENIFSGMEISYHEPFGAIYDQVFPGASSWCGVSEAMLDGFHEGGEKKYIRSIQREPNYLQQKRDWLFTNSWLIFINSRSFSASVF